MQILLIASLTSHLLGERISANVRDRLFLFIIYEYLLVATKNRIIMAMINLEFVQYNYVRKTTT